MMYVVPSLACTATVSPAGLIAVRVKSAPRGAAVWEVTWRAVMSQAYTVPFVPMVTRLSSESIPVATFGTEPGLVNRTGFPVTPPPSPGVAASPAVDAAEPVGAADADVPAAPGLPPEVCDWAPEVTWSMNTAKAAEAARAATVVAVTRHRPGLNGGRVAPPGTAPLSVPPATAPRAPGPVPGATGPYA